MGRYQGKPKRSGPEWQEYSAARKRATLDTSIARLDSLVFHSEQQRGLDPDPSPLAKKYENALQSQLEALRLAKKLEQEKEWTRGMPELEGSWKRAHDDVQLHERAFQKLRREADKLQTEVRRSR